MNGSLSTWSLVFKPKFPIIWTWWSGSCSWSSSSSIVCRIALGVSVMRLTLLSMKKCASATRLECQSSCARDCNSAGWSMLPWKTAPAYASGLLKSVKLGRAAPSRGREDLDRARKRKGRELLHRTTPETGRTHLRARRALRRRQGSERHLVKVAGEDLRILPDAARLEPTCDVPRKGNRKPGCETSCCGHGRPQLCRTAR